MKINENYLKLRASYLFSEVAKRVKNYSAEHPDAKIIRLGIGDVTLPLSPCVISALHAAVDEMGSKDTFRGYCPEHGYDFVREAVKKHYARFGVDLSIDNIFISDGAKSDVGNITDILGDNEILIPDPVYPVYRDSNIMCGRNISYINASADNMFLPGPEGQPMRSRVIYICSPNNPTGAVYDCEGLKAWVEYANKTDSLIIFDSAYEAFIKDGEKYPHSIFEIEGADSCAIEICSLSKTAGFTGTRCAWTVIPDKLSVDGVKLSDLWERRQSTKFNGVPYIVQKAAEAALSDVGREESSKEIEYYMENARMIADLLTKKGIYFTGGINSPYIWLKCPNGMDSWAFFDYLLDKANVVGTPGSGFGTMGEGYFRLTAFGSHEATAEAVARMNKIL